MTTKITSLLLALLLIASLASQVFAEEMIEVYPGMSLPEEKVTKIIQNKFVTYLNDSLVGKREVINYWLMRLKADYRPSHLNNYIISEPDSESIVTNAMRLLIQLEQTELTPQEKINFVRDNRKDLFIYSVEDINTTNPKFTIRYAGDEIVKEHFPNVNTWVSVNRLNNASALFYRENELTQLELYKSLDYYGIPNNMINPISFSNVDVIMSSPFGNRGDLYFGATNVNNHTGIDLAMPTGTEIAASQAGTVIKVVISDWGFGRYCVIDHGGYYSLYAHCSKLFVSEGVYVRKGDIIGEVGSTGWSTGPHLHFEVIANGGPIDPYPIIVPQKIGDEVNE